MSLTVYMVRHGQTYFNRYNRMQGWSDSPLTTKGIEDAKRAGEKLSHLPFSHAYCSDTTRAMNTANQILALNKAGSIDKLHITPFFREQFYGYFEGEDSPKAWYMTGFPHGSSTFADIVNDYSLDKSKDFMKAADPFHEAENAKEYWTRVSQGFELLRKENTDEALPILIVSHGTTIRSVVGRYSTQFDVTQSPKNGSITKLHVSADNIDVAYYNQLALQD